MTARRTLPAGGALTRRALQLLSLVSLAALLSACAVSQPLNSADGLADDDIDARVLVMPIDIELQELTAGGQLLPHAAWTLQGRSNVNQALDSLLVERGEQVVRYGDGGADPEIDEAHLQVVKLHGAVGGSIMMHNYIQHFKLPTKEGKLDWTLGNQAVALREAYDADYALFVFFRDSFATAGRAALIFVGALFGAHVQGGHQVGFASLIDLNSGDVVWFNRLFSGAGDLREAERAQSATETLLDNLPL